MVKSQIVKANGELVKVDYLMRLNGEGWLISDVYLDRALSARSLLAAPNSAPLSEHKASTA
jgi:hypothetical protein